MTALSILTSTKKALGLADEYVAYDPDILMFINTAFSTLNQLGLGPEEGFAIVDKEATWDAFFTDLRLNGIQTYVYLRVRNLFDPPTTSYLIEAMDKQRQELESRLNLVREGDSWVDPFLPTP